MNRFGFVGTAIFFICLSGAIAGDWPQYLGPDRNAVSSETGLLAEWPESGPETLWSFPLEEGYGAPAVSEGKVFLLDRIDGRQDVLRCIDIETGKELWKFAYDADGNFGKPGSRSVPCISGNRVYTCGPLGDIYCIDITTHQPVWNKSLTKGFGNPASLNWGFGQNPLIYNDMLIVAPMTDTVGIAALNPETGDVIWTSDALPGRPSYVSPCIVSIDGEEHLVMISATNERSRGRRRDRSNETQNQDTAASDANKGAIIGFDPTTGKALWKYTGWQCNIPIPNVVEIGDGRLFISGGYMAGSAMFRVSKNNGAYEVEELYTTQDFGVHCHPPVLYKNHLYGHCTTNETNDGMVCMNLDGEVQWKTGRSPVFNKGGFILVDNKIISVDGRDGYLYLIDPSPDGFKPISKAKLLEPGEIWSPLALSNGKLLIRDHTQMICVKVK